MVLILVFSMFPSSWTAGWVRQCNCRRTGAVCCPAVGLLDGFGSATAEEWGRFVARQLDCWMGSAVQLSKNKRFVSRQLDCWMGSAVQLSKNKRFVSRQLDCWMGLQLPKNEAFVSQQSNCWLLGSTTAEKQ